MARETITQRISLEGGEEVKKQLQDIGKAGEDMGAKLNSSGGGAGIGAGVNNLASSVDKAKQSFSSLGSIFDQIKQKAGIAFQGLNVQMMKAPQQVQEINTALGGIAGTAVRTVSTVGTVAAGAILALAQTGSKAGVEIAKGAEALKTTTEDFQKLQEIANASGMGDGLSKQFDKMSESARKAADAANEAGSALSGGFIKSGNIWTTTAAQGFKSLAEQAEFARGNIERMSVTMVQGGVTSQAIQNIKTYEDAIKALGISQTEFRDGMERARPLKDIYSEAAQVLARLPPSLDRTRIAQLALGEESGRWLRLIEQGPAAVDAALQKINNSGRALTKNQIADAQDYAAAFAGLRSAVSATAQQIGLVFAPSLTKLANDFADAIDRNRAAMVGWVSGELAIAGPVLTSLGEAFQKIIALDLAGAIDKIKEAFSRLWKETDGSKGAGVWVLLTAGALAFAGLVVGVVMPAIRGIIFLLTRIPGLLVWTIRFAPFLLVLVYLGEILAFMGKIKDAFGNIFSGNITAGFGNLKDAFGTLFSGLANAGVGTWTLIGLAAFRTFFAIQARWATLAAIFTGIGTAGSSIWGVITATAVGGAALVARAWAAVGGGAAFASLATRATAAFSVIGLAARGLLAMLAPLLGWPGLLITAFAIIGTLINWDSIAAGASSAWETIKSGASATWEFLKGVFTGDPATFAKIGDFFSGAWDKIKAGASATWEFVKGVFRGDSSTFASIGGFFSGIWEGVKSAASSAWTGIVSFIIDSNVKAIQAVMKVWQGLKDFVSSIFGSSAQAATPQVAPGTVQGDPAAARKAGEVSGEQFRQGVSSKTGPIGTDLAKGFAQGAQQVAGAVQPATQAVTALSQASNNLGNGPTQFANGVAGAMAPAAASTENFGAKIIQLGESVNQTGTKLQQVQTGLAGAGTAAKTAETGFNGVKTVINSVAGQFEIVNGKVTKTGEAITRAGSTASEAAKNFEAVSGTAASAGKGFDVVSGAGTKAASSFEVMSGKAQAAKEALAQAFTSPPGVVTITKDTGEVIRILESLPPKASAAGASLSSAFTSPPGVVTITKDTGEIIRILESMPAKATAVKDALASAFSTPASAAGITGATAEITRGFDEVSGKAATTKQSLSTVFSGPVDSGSIAASVTAVSTGMQTLAATAATVGPAVSASLSQVSAAALAAADVTGSIGPKITTSLQSVNATLPGAIDWTQLTSGLTSLDIATPLTAKLTEFASSLTSMDWSGVTTGLTTAFQAISPAVQSVFQQVQSAIQTAMQSAAASVQSASQSMISSLNAVAAAAEKAAAAVAAASSAKASSSSATQSFATGGYVSGPGTGTSDSILARVSNGEFVMQARAVRRYGINLLAAINSGRYKLPKFAEGGFVGQMSGGLSGINPTMDLGGLVSDSAGGGMSGRPVNITLDGQTYGLSAPEETAKNMEKLASRSRLRQAGRKPGWFK